MNMKVMYGSFEAWEADLKRHVNRRKKEENLKTGHCYETYAKEEGFQTYAAYRAHMKEILPAKFTRA